MDEYKPYEFGTLKPLSDKPDTENAISAMLHDAVAKVSKDIADAEEGFIIKAIMLAGYEPIASEDAEWRKHITLHHEAPWRKVICVDGQPKWAVVTEAPTMRIGDSSMVQSFKYTTRMEQVPYAYGESN